MFDLKMPSGSKDISNIQTEFPRRGKTSCYFLQVMYFRAQFWVILQMQN